MNTKRAKKSVPSKQALKSSAGKAPRLIPGTQRSVDDHVAWRFELICGEPCFGWDTLTADDHKCLNEWLAIFEGMTLGELFNNSGRPGKTYRNPHEIPNVEARGRFLDRYDDEDEIHRLRCDGEHRIYGFRRGNVFLVLWWDPNHEVWPSSR